MISLFTSLKLVCILKLVCMQNMRNSSRQGLSALPSRSLLIFYQLYTYPFLIQMKEVITDKMQLSDSSLRLLLATQAYSMGTDCPNVRRVVNVGPPNNMESKFTELDTIRL